MTSWADNAEAGEGGDDAVAALAEGVQNVGLQDAMPESIPALDMSLDSLGSDPLDEANLFVGDLAKEVNEQDLRDAFGEHGTVLGVDIKRDRVTRSSLGYGFVQYATRRCAEDESPAPSACRP